MTERQTIRSRQLATMFFVLIGVAGVLWVALGRTNLEWLRIAALPEPVRMLNGQLRLRIGDPDVFQNFLLGLRVYHYRAQLREQTAYRDIYYDTTVWNLHARGISYRFRTRLSGKRKYSTCIFQRHAAAADSTDECTLKSDVPKSLGEAIVAGAWERALTDGIGLAAPERLREILRELQIDPGQVGPQLVGELARSRFGITDKGRRWFKLYHEEWEFRLFAAPQAGRSVEFQEIVIEPDPDERGADLQRRIRTMEEFALTMYPFQISELPPRLRAMAALGLSSALARP